MKTGTLTNTGNDTIEAVYVYDAETAKLFKKVDDSFFLQGSYKSEARAAAYIRRYAYSYQRFAWETV